MQTIRRENSEDKAYFIENIVDDKTKHTRKNKHVLYIPEQKRRFLALLRVLVLFSSTRLILYTVNMNINTYISYINLNKSN